MDGPRSDSETPAVRRHRHAAPPPAAGARRWILAAASCTVLIVGLYSCDPVRTSLVGDSTPAPSSPTESTSPSLTTPSAPVSQILAASGSTGSIVSEAQARLGLPTDGIYGETTVAAVADFQMEHGLEADGNLTEETWALLKKLPVPTTSTPTTKPPTTKPPTTQPAPTTEPVESSRLAAPPSAEPEPVPEPSASAEPEAPAPEPPPQPAKPAPPAPPPPKPEPAGDTQAFASQVVALTNAERAKQGLAPLAPSDCATGFAVTLSNQLAPTGQLEHQDLGPIMNKCGARGAAENIAYNYSDDPAEIVQQWMNSEGHRKNILSPGLTHIGVGIARGSDGSWFGTQDFLTLG